jgi:hypothetical protein
MLKYWLTVSRSFNSKLMQTSAAKMDRTVYCSVLTYFVPLVR